MKRGSILICLSVILKRTSVVFLFLASLVLIGCSHFLVGTDPQYKPTQAFEAEQAHKKADAKIEIDSNWVIVDGRTPFEFAVSHIPGSLNIYWQDFSMPQGPQMGLIDSDLNAVTRRLSILGIDINSKVLVVGDFSRSKGQEARVAWMLRYLGVQVVKIQDVHQFLSKKGVLPDKPRENSPPWKAQLQEDWLVSKAEFSAGMFIPKVKANAPAIIDVRSEKEYLGKKGQDTKPDVGAVNIPYEQFYKSNGQINFEILPKLQAIGLTFDKQIWVISEQGVRSGAVTFALREMGYNRAANFAGGYRELFAP